MKNEPRKPYSERLRDPRWQKRRLQIMERDKWTCQKCLDNTSTLNVHHRWYESGKDPWDYQDEALVTLCERCHTQEYEERPEAEARLLRILRLAFFAGEIRVIGDAFHYMTFSCEPEVFAAALDHFLLDTSNVEKMVEAYLKHVQESDRH